MCSRREFVLVQAGGDSLRPDGGGGRKSGVVCQKQELRETFRGLLSRVYIYSGVPGYRVGHIIYSGIPGYRIGYAL